MEGFSSEKALRALGGAPTKQMRMISIDYNGRTTDFRLQGLGLWIF
ncbi:MAG: hypothetical protein QHC78_12260 [Pigmentiphaga sp.]|nr:hypothetical protein [Pigmentiphaga sp.]MDX3906453.1 hypothetical protein [Pigmentiphaga sp.]